MKRSLLVLLVIVGFVSFVSALSFEAKPEAWTFVQEFKDPVNVVVSVHNATPGNYRFYTLADIEIEPFGFFSVSKKDFVKNFSFRPAESLKVSGAYTFTCTLERQLGEKARKKFTFEILPLRDVLKISSETINPDSDFVEFYVENLKDCYLRNLSADFTSLFFRVHKDFDLKPHEKKIFRIKPDKSFAGIKAGVYVLDAVFDGRNGEKIGVSGNLYLGEKEGISSDESSYGILIRKKRITKTNIGNVVTRVSVEVKKNWFSRIFTSFNVEPTMVEKDGFGVRYVWVKERLGPGESFVVEVRTNYLLPLIALFGIVFFVLGFNRYSKAKVILEKSVSPVRTRTKVFAFKINLRVKAKESVENLSIIDQIPPMVKVYKEFGAFKPDKIDRENRRLHWNIGDLDAGEQRTISYIVYTKLKLLGKFSLPEALAVFESEGKIEEVNSNKVFFEGASEEN